MAADVAILTVHGMGDTPGNYAGDLEARLAKKLGSANWSRVHFGAIYYQKILQDNQKRMFDDMKANSEIDYIKLRKFLLYGFSDAAGLERNATADGSPYELAQEQIRDTLALAALGNPGKPVILIAQSLGCQVISNYIWDAQAANPGQGVWKNSPPTGTPGDNFLRLKTLRFLFTTGCNIPIFLAGFPEEELKAVKTRTDGYAFEWHNYYDEDDVLGWPMKPMSDSFEEAVTADHAINADGGLLGKIVSGWNPLSHNEYWKDGEFLDPLGRAVKSLIP